MKKRMNFVSVCRDALQANSQNAVVMRSVVKEAINVHMAKKGPGAGGQNPSIDVDVKHYGRWSPRCM
jgi:hypothetical protein